MPNNILLPCGHESIGAKDNITCLPCQKFITDQTFHNLCVKLNKQRLESQKPNIIDRTKNFFEAGSKYIQAGMPSLLNDDVQMNRMKLCSDCTENKDGICVAMNKETGKSCGCYIAAKTKVPTEECPVGKWKRIELPTLTPKKTCGGCGPKN